MAGRNAAIIKVIDYTCAFFLLPPAKMFAVRKLLRPSFFRFSARWPNCVIKGPHHGYQISLEIH